MKHQYTDQLINLLKKTRHYAAQLHSKSVRPEHILLTMIKDRYDFPNQAMEHLNVDKEAVTQKLLESIQDIFNRQEQNNEPVNAETKEISEDDILFNDQTNSILRLADLEARMSHDHDVDVKHLLLAMLHDGMNSVAKDIMEENNMNYDNILDFCEEYAPAQTPTNGLDLTDDDMEDEGGSSASNTQTTEKPKGKGTGKKTPVIDNFSTDLTQAAAEGKLDPCVGREKEIQRLTEILGRRKKNNPILIGEPGVGKSAIVEGLAQRIADNRTSPILFNKRLVALDMAGMVAGTKYRGQFEERIKALIKEYHLENRIIIHPFTNNIQQFYSKAQIYVLSSRWEGMPLVLVEAMSLGLPIVTSDLPVCKEILGDFGIYFKNGDTNELAKRLEDATHIDWPKKSKQAIEIAHRFEVGPIIQQWKDLIEK